VDRHPRNPHISNKRFSRILIRASRAREKLWAKCVFLLAGSDFGVSLPASTFLPHPHGIVVGRGVRLGSHVVIGHQVTLGGTEFDLHKMPEIRDGVYLGAGCKVLGPVVVGEGATVGANAVVTKDIPPGSVVVGANRILEGHRSPYAR